MALKNFLSRVNRPIDEIDRDKLETFSLDAGGQPLAEIEPRSLVHAVGEIKTVRIVPRAGAPALEVVISDGRGSLTGIFLGRRKVGGVVAGRRLAMHGMVVKDAHRNAIFNPIYELL